MKFKNHLACSVLGFGHRSDMKNDRHYVLNDKHKETECRGKRGGRQEEQEIDKK